MTPELEKEIRSKINPAYVDVKGTESRERKILFDEIDRLRTLNSELLYALKHLEHNARKSGGEMGLALDVAQDAIAKAKGEMK